MTPTPPHLPAVRLTQTAVLPTYAHGDDAGMDLVSDDAVTIAPGARALVGTGIAVAIPHGYAGFVHPRSGMAARRGVTVLNAPGTIDSGYRGEVKVCLVNTDPEAAFEVAPGDRIAQLVIQQVSHLPAQEVTSLEDTERGTAGFGSTGGFGN